MVEIPDNVENITQELSKSIGNKCWLPISSTLPKIAGDKYKPAAWIPRKNTVPTLNEITKLVEWKSLDTEGSSFPSSKVSAVHEYISLV